ncbi:phospholipase C, phosphocholine-specific [Variovorax sp. LjRoot130]|uniref:phosphocholine-specific phospholipase C n=1 Tax=Variovorax sp. LjRoot130 TaxID=3342261 RepID=UPI003ECF75C4
MNNPQRRDFLRKTAGTLGAASALTMLPPSIRRALAVEAAVETRTIQDVKHIVILMQENRSFSHYFGTMRGVRGFGDRFPIPLESGKPVWFQSNGTKEIPPYHLDKEKTNALLVPSTPHSFSDSQAAWNQGKFGQWPKYKNQYSMGYYKREDIPFQFALAEAFTICDAYHCSITTGTDPNRIVFWSGSNFNPELGRRGINSTDTDAEPNNLRCWIKGTMPTPGYTYAGSSFQWPTLPDLLEKAGISWRIYQDPNDNWTGAMHGGLAFESFRNATATSGSPLYEKGMKKWTLADLRNDVINGTLPAVLWVLPAAWQSEHPGAGSSPAKAGDFTSQVLDAITASTESWSKTVFFLTFDENDGLFDHLPPPAVPSYNADGTLAGKSTVPLDGEYFSDPARRYLKPEDTISGNVRPWGLSARVPMYVVSPWSKGGWVDSQVFDHTSVGMFLEKRFGITVDSISPWHRAVCGDLSSAFDFKTPNDPKWPQLPDMSNYAAIEAGQKLLPAPVAPAMPQPLFQETGTRFSRALPYELHTSARVEPRGMLSLVFANSGKQGAVFHVYDKLHLDRIPRRYTVEAGKTLTDTWNTGLSDSGKYELWVYGPNGYVRSFKGDALFHDTAAFKPEVQIGYQAHSGHLYLRVHNSGKEAGRVTVTPNAYLSEGPWTMKVRVGTTETQHWNLQKSGDWYDFTVTSDNFERRFAGRVETGKPGVSDPAMALHLKS